MSFILNPPEGGELPKPDYPTNPTHLLEICRTLDDIFGVLEGNPYYSILIEFFPGDIKSSIYELWVKTLVRQYDNIQLYEIDGLCLFAIPGDDEKKQHLRLLVITKRKK